MLIGAELNCIGAVRGYVAGALSPSRLPDSLKSVLRECAGQASFSAPEIARAKAHILKDMVRGALTAIWLWKTGTTPFQGSAADWNALLNEFSGEGIWTRDITLKQRSNLIVELAKYLVSEQALSQAPRLGPQVFEVASTRVPDAPTIEDKPDTTITSNIPQQEVASEPVSQPAASQSSAPVKPAIDTIDLYLKHVLPPEPSYIPAEWRELIGSATSVRRAFIQGEVGSGKTNLLYAIGHELKKAAQVPLYIRVSDYAPHAANMDILHFAAYEGAF